MGRRWTVTLATALVAVACTTPTAAPSPVPPIASATRPGTAAPTQPADRGDLASRLRPMANGWRPRVPNLVIASSAPGDRTALTAIEPASGDVTLLATFFRHEGWSFSGNGDALVVALETSATTSRIAYWEPSTSSTGWLTPDQERVVVH